MPQWDFLDFITDEAARYPGFRLLMNAEVVDLIQEHGVVRGLTYRDGTGAHDSAPASPLAPMAAAHAPARRGLRVIATSPPMDVLWFRLSRRPEEPETIAMRSGPGKAAILIDRRDYWQIGYIIPKGDAEKVRAAGLAPFRRTLAELIPDLADRVDEIQEWEQVKLLTVRSDRLALVHARLPRHRRCRSRHVAGRRRGDQPGHSGRGRRRQRAVAAAAPRPHLDPGSGEGAA